MNLQDTFFTKGVQKTFGLMFPSQRCPLGKAMTIEGCYDATEPVDDWSVFGELLYSFYARYDFDFTGRYGNGLLFLTHKNSVFRVIQYCKESRKAFSMRSIDAFGKFIRPILEKEDQLGCMVTDFKDNTVPFHNARNNVRLQNQLARSFDLDKLSYKVSKHALYVIDDFEVVGVFPFYPSNYDFKLKITFSNQALSFIKNQINQSLVRKSGTITSLLFDYFNKSRIDNSTRHTAVLADAYSRHPSIEPVIYSCDEVVFVLDKSTGVIMDIYPSPNLRRMNACNTKPIDKQAHHVRKNSRRFIRDRRKCRFA